MNLDDLAKMDWLEPWGAVARPISTGLEAELEKEVVPGHPLYGHRVAAVGRRFDRDEVLYFIKDGAYPLAVVHLLWREKVEGEDSLWPWTVFYSSMEEWRKESMRPANHEIFGTW
jgi:hypothetical protein